MGRGIRARLSGLAGAVLFGAAALLGCERRRPPPGDVDPAPSGQVAMVGVGLGSCEDVTACEAECDAGSADRCRRLAASFAFGQGVAKDEARATALYEHACALGDPPACVFAGQMHEFGHGVPKDVGAAVGPYERACALHWAAGCYNLAIVLERGVGVTRDAARAADLYAIACNAGAKEACVRAEALRDGGGARAPDAAP
jgi:TPR repeat protein